MPKSLIDLIVASNAGKMRVMFPDAVVESFRKGEWPASIGAPGPQGPPGAGIVWLGAWSAAILYLEGDGVEHNGSSYVAITENLASAPPSANWDLFAAKGDTGAQGAIGTTGTAGSNGAPGADGAAGPAGPNTVTGTTTSTLTGILKGTGSLVAVATAPADYVATADSRLSDARTPTAHTHSQSDITSLVSDLALKAPLASPTFTGTPTLPTGTIATTQSAADSTTKVATTAFATTADNLKAPLASPTFTGTVSTPGITVTSGSDILMSDGSDIVAGTTTGTKIGGGATEKIGFWGVTPIVRSSALTQTYSTASSTHAAVTQLAAPAGGTGIAAGGWSSAANRDLAIVSINAARTDIANIKNFVNQIVDQLQAIGLLQ